MKKVHETATGRDTCKKLAEAKVAKAAALLESAADLYAAAGCPNWSKMVHGIVSKLDRDYVGAGA